eukprot:2547893-Rhodomonas_salina.4
MRPRRAHLLPAAAAAAGAEHAGTGSRCCRWIGRHLLLLARTAHSCPSSLRPPSQTPLSMDRFARPAHQPTRWMASALSHRRPSPTRTSTLRGWPRRPAATRQLHAHLRFQRSSGSGSSSRPVASRQLLLHTRDPSSHTHHAGRSGWPSPRAPTVDTRRPKSVP